MLPNRSPLSADVARWPCWVEDWAHLYIQDLIPVGLMPLVTDSEPLGV